MRTRATRRNVQVSTDPKPSRRIPGRIFLAAALLVAVGVLLAATVPSLRWRARIVLLQARGAIPDISWQDVLTFIEPGSNGYNNVARIIETRNPYAVIGNPLDGSENVRAGGELFANQCTTCHGNGGSGSAAAPMLVDREFKHGGSDWAIYRTIRFGVPGTAMRAQPNSFRELWQLVAYIRSLRARPAHGAAPGFAGLRVPYEELEATGAPGNDWLTFSGSYDSHRISTLTQIDPVNVGQLTLQWVRQFEGEFWKIETSPVVKDGTMIVTTPNSRVEALNAATGSVIWKYQGEVAAGALGGKEFATPVNRGVALLDDKVYVATADARLIALSSASGEVVWDTRVADMDHYYITAAPLAYRDLVVTGVATLPDSRGFIAAYDAATGKERWRFSTVPEPGQPGNDTWAGDSWHGGGAPTWMTGSYDVERDLLIWGAGNPKPDYDAAARKGDNLYSNTALALRGTTGALVWHFQFTPADDKDWDSNQVPVLADLPTPDGPAPRVLWANRNGFYYVLDRTTGRYITSQPFVHQTWTAGIDAGGRPLPPSHGKRRREGTEIYPGNQGGTNWWPPSYDAGLGLIFVPAIEQGMVFFPSAMSTPRDDGKPFYTAIRALNAATGQLVWEYRGEPRTNHPEISGLLSTRSGLLFGGDAGQFFAFESKTGRQLWSVYTGGTMGAPPITYAVDGVQYIAVATGRDLMAFALPQPLRATESVAQQD